MAVIEDKDLPIISDITGRDVAKIILRAKKFAIYFRDRESLEHKYHNDYDGIPLQDWHSLIKLSPSKKELWSIEVEYQPSDGEDYEYISMAGFDRNTAHKMDFSGPVRATKFSACKYWFKKNSNGSEETLESTYRYVVFVCDRLDSIASDLVAWAGSGFDMQLLCKDYSYCRTFEDIIISNDILKRFAANGLSIEALNSRLTCKKCGARNPLMWPI
jgi:hypothetical protein